MVEKKGLKIHHKNTKLTKTEKEILRLVTEEFLTIKQIKLRRHCSLQAIYKHLKNIKKKGHIGSGLKKVEKIQSTIQPNDVRLHAQEFNIKIIYQDALYQKRLKKSNLIFLDSNTIRLYKNSIEIYSGNSFIGKTEAEADKKSIEYWFRFFNRLESELNIIIIKNRSRNIKEVSHHYARGNSEIAENSIENKEPIRVFAKEDGKLCFITDDSFGFKEDETLHPITAKPDRKAIDKQVNDWRLNNPPTNSEIWQITSQNVVAQQKSIEMINILVKNQSEQNKSIKEFAVALNRHIPAYEGMANKVSKLDKTINELKNVITSLGKKDSIKRKNYKDGNANLDRWL